MNYGKRIYNWTAGRLEEVQLALRIKLEEAIEAGDKKEERNIRRRLDNIVDEQDRRKLLRKGK